METAEEMSKNISSFTNSDYGIGVTGKLNRADSKNLYGEDNVVYISVYDKDNCKFYNEKVVVGVDERDKNKNIIIQKVVQILEQII